MDSESQFIHCYQLNSCSGDPKASEKYGVEACIDWAKNWQMEFNLSKCKLLGMGKNNENRDYRM